MGSEFDAVPEHVPYWYRHLLLAREMHDTQAHPAFTTACCCSQLGRALQKQKNRQKRENEVAWLWRKKMTPALALAPKYIDENRQLCWFTLLSLSLIHI